MKPGCGVTRAGEALNVRCQCDSIKSDVILLQSGSLSVSPSALSRERYVMGIVAVVNVLPVLVGIDSRK